MLLSRLLNKEIRMAGKRKPRSLTVTASKQLTKNMLRLTLTGEDLADIPDDAAGAYFKLAFESSNAEQPAMRTYTVANYRKNQLEIDVDFMLHSNTEAVTDGVAATWAMQAKVGDSISIFGPGPATFVHLAADWFLLAADMTALPALTANLQRLPSDATGYVVVEILSDEDRQDDLKVPSTMELQWVINPNPGSDDSPLAETIKSLPWLQGQPAIWTACEFKTMRKIRQYYRETHSVPKSHLYISSYWKLGLKEEEHKVEKRKDSSTPSLLSKIKSAVTSR